MMFMTAYLKAGTLVGFPKYILLEIIGGVQLNP